MYFVRIVFFQVDGFDFVNISEEQKELFEKDGCRCNVKSKNQGKKKKIILEYGGFKTKDTAINEGTNLLRSLKVEMCRQGCPINISGIMGILDCENLSVMPGRFTEYGLGVIRKDLINKGIITNDKIVMEDVLGMEVYEVKESLDEIHFVAQSVDIVIKSDFKISLNEYNNWNEKLDIALSLLSTSNLINDVRIKFLLKIMAIEVLVSDKQYKEKEYKDVISKIIKSMNECEVDKNIKDKIKNDLGLLKIKSIGEKCYHLILKYCKEKKYCEASAVDFFKECYKIRSSFVHAGKMDISKINEYDNELKNLSIDVLLAYGKELVNNNKQNCS